jgi:hypothetical protein
MLKYI